MLGNCADALAMVRLDGTSVERPIEMHHGGEVIKSSCATVDLSIKVNASPARGFPAPKPACLYQRDSQFVMMNASWQGRKHRAWSIRLRLLRPQALSQRPC